MVKTVETLEYKPPFKPNQLIYGKGNTLIVTGWTVAKKIKSKLDDSDYLAIGQLYSPTRGINLLVRNILANPFIKSVVGISATKEDKNAGSVLALYDFFEKGVNYGVNDLGIPCWVVNGDIPAYIDSVIPKQDLDILRNQVTFDIALDLEQAVSLVNYRNKTITNRYWNTPRTYPYTKTEPDTLPGDKFGHVVTGATIAETWVKIIHRIVTNGVKRPTGYDGEWQELINLVSIVTDEPDGYYIPDYIPVTHEFIQNYIPQMLADAENKPGVKYTYGQRMRSWFGVDQIKQVIGKLIDEIDAASAVISLWDVQDHVTGGSPCLNHIWFRVNEGVLSMTATFRSNDMFSAWCSNAMGLRALQKHVIDEINNQSDYNLTLGNLVTISQSAHIYDDCWENAKALIDNQYKKLCHENHRKFTDPVGSFLISWCDGLHVSQITPGSGVPIRDYQGKQPLPLVRDIIDSNPSIDPSHAAYLGLELCKCYQQKSEYQQDK